MSEIKVSKLTNRSGTGAPDFSQGVKIEGTASTLLAPTRTESATEPTSPSNGDTWYDTDNDVYDIYINDEWKRFIGEGGGSAVWYGDRGIMFGKNTAIEYWDMTTSGNASDFGDSNVDGSDVKSSHGNGTRALVFGGFASSASSNVIDYITVSTTGNATDFGDLLTAVTRASACGDATYGVVSGGFSSTTINVIQYVTMATEGNALDFGDMSSARDKHGAANDATRGVFFGGRSPRVNTIEYITVATTGNTTDFGDLTAVSEAGQATSDDTYAVHAMGYTGATSNSLDYITIQTTGNATDFGDLVTAGFNSAACSNGTVGHFINGGDGDAIQEITIATTGNASSFGSLTANHFKPTMSSGAAS